VEAALVHNCAGRGRVGADFWPVLQATTAGARRKASSIANRYPESYWANLGLDAGTEIILAPGPRGALPTENFEQLRQGIQECQARIFIEKAILAKRLDPELAKKCQEVLDERLWHLRGLGACGGVGTFFGVEMTSAWFEGTGSAGMAEKLFAAAAEVARAPRSR